MTVAALVLASLIPIPMPDPVTAAKIAEAIRVLRKIEGVLATVNRTADMIQSRLESVYPRSVLDILPHKIKIPPALLSIYRGVKCGWNFTPRLQGILRPFQGFNICRDEWYRFFGPPVDFGATDFDEYRDWSSVTRMNVIASRIKSGERNERSAQWLLDKATLGSLKAGDRASPGFSERIGAMASAAEGAIAAETGDTLLEILKLDSERLMDKAKARRDSGRAALAIYEDLVRSPRASAGTVLPGGLL